MVEISSDSDYSRTGKFENKAVDVAEKTKFTAALQWCVSHQMDAYFESRCFKVIFA
jgi:hypothetical protein